MNINMSLSVFGPLFQTKYLGVVQLIKKGGLQSNKYDMIPTGTNKS